MKYLKEFILVVFSVCMLGLAIVAILTSLEVLKFGSILNSIVNYIVYNKILVIGISFSVSLLALVGIFAYSDREEDVKSGLAIKHEAGTVYITKDTFKVLF